MYGFPKFGRQLPPDLTRISFEMLKVVEETNLEIKEDIKEKKNSKVTSSNNFYKDSSFDWNLILNEIDLSVLLKQILFSSSVKKIDNKIIISLPEDKITRINEEYKKEISSCFNNYFNQILEISYDSNVEVDRTPLFIKDELKIKESNEAVDLISKDEGFKKITSELNTDIKNISKK